MTKNIKKAAEKYGAENILVASFTKSAAEELVGRNIEMKDRVGTLHSHCYRALGSPEIAEMHIKEFNEKYPSFTLSTQSKDIDDLEITMQTQADELFAEYQTLRARMIDPRLYPYNIKSFVDAWEEWKSENGYISFTDMIQIAYDEIDCAPGEPLVGFYDEVQDFTKLELSLIRKWAQKQEFVVLAGDDDQCLYSFKGSSPEAFIGHKIPDNQIRILKQSYRVPKKIHEFSKKMINRIIIIRIEIESMTGKISR